MTNIEIIKYLKNNNVDLAFKNSKNKSIFLNEILKFDEYLLISGEIETYINGIAFSFYDVKNIKSRYLLQYASTQEVPNKIYYEGLFNEISVELIWQ